MTSRAFVSLIGAGPGDPGLLTLRGKATLEAADVVLFDYLANPELLKHAPQARTIYVGKKGFSEYISQPEINALIVQQAQIARRAAGGAAQGGRRVRIRARLRGSPGVRGRGHPV